MLSRPAHGHRYGDELIAMKAPKEWAELTGVISSVTDDEVKKAHEKFPPPTKSPSKAINKILSDKLLALGWKAEPYLFKAKKYQKHAWRLDFVKNEVVVEVAFNHGGSVSWNLIKPCLAAELSHLDKEEAAARVQFGVIIAATNKFKKEGGFDSAVGSFETFVEYLGPMRDFLQPPLVIIGLEPLEKYKMVHSKKKNRLHGTFVKR